MRLFQKASIQRKQTLIVMVTTAAALLLACAAFTANEVMNFRKEMVRNLFTLADIVDHNTFAALDFNDPKNAAETLGAFAAEPNIIGACIFNKDGTVFATYDRPGDNILFQVPKIQAGEYSKFQEGGYKFNDRGLALYKPIVENGTVIGTVYLESDLNALYSRLKQYAIIVGCVFLLTFLAALLLSGRLQRLISEPILHLVQTARDVAIDRNYSVRAVKRSEDELGVLTDSFNEMLEQIQERDAALQKNQDELENRVKQRTGELASSLSLLNATLESTADGILVTDSDGNISHFNEKFAAMWHIMGEVAKTRDRERMLTTAVSQLKDAEDFVARIKELEANPEPESFDVLEFKDGRVFERYSKPQWLGDKCVGRVWSYRDITQRKQAEAELANSLSLLHATLESTADGILAVNRAGNILHFNKKFVTMWRVPLEIAESRDQHKMLNNSRDQVKDPGQFIARIMELEKNPGQDSFELLELKDGRVFERDSIPQWINDQCVGRVWSFRDITARKQAEAALAHERDLLRTLLDNSPDCIYFKDLDSRYTLCSRSLGGLLNCAPETIAGKSNFDFLIEQHARETHEIDQTIIQTGEPLIGNIEYRATKDGTARWMLTNKMPLRNKSGEIIGTFGISKDITALKEAEADLKRAHEQLLTTSRLAGMAEVATSVLHNVGNVLNSVNISTSLVSEKVRNSKVANLGRAIALMNAHAADIPGFLANDPKGRQLPSYLGKLATHLMEEQTGILEELASLCGNVEHIKEIVAMQQNYARVSGLVETLPAVDLIEDALRMNAGAMERHGVRIIREFSPVPPILVERHKILQILVNLIRNAKYAVDENRDEDKRMTLRLEAIENDFIRISVIDNGVGIPAENLTRIFSHGFTTRKEGHGFGLHSAALAAKDLGGSLNVHSDGPGKGATFVVEIPLAGKK